MNYQLLNWQTDVRLLGNYLNSALDNSVDSNIKYSQFIGQFNSLKTKFGCCCLHFSLVHLSLDLLPRDS